MGILSHMHLKRLAARLCLDTSVASVYQCTETRLQGTGWIALY